MSFVIESLAATWQMLLEASPYILFGLLVAGLIHVLLPESLVLRWMGRPGLSGVVRAAVIGVPLPVCSCGVVPITVELGRKGASRPATQSFLITTPESSIDSIFLTWGLMGPLMAIARPIGAFATAVLGGVLSIASARSLDELSAAPDEHCPVHGPDADDHGHDHDHAVTYSRSEQARRALWAAVSTRGGLVSSSLWSDLVRPSLRYGFGELLEDLAFWLVLGLGVAGVMTAALPDDLGALGLGTGILPMIFLLAVGVPMYMCASASTPIAAALLAKGVSPGAALVFLLAGPATNAATVLLLVGTFGRRFVQIYLASVVAGALGAGLLLDALLIRGGAKVASAITTGQTTPGALSLFATIVLLALLARSLWRGAWTSGVGELRAAWRRLADHLPWLSVPRVTATTLVAAAFLYLAGGLRVVPPHAHGFGFLFGALVWEDLEPGLHYVPPAPFGSWELRRTTYARKADVGFRTDLELLKRRRQLVLRASSKEWHSPVAAMNADPRRTTYLTADENLIEMSFSVHYTLSDPATFFYGVDHQVNFVELYAESVARELVAGARMEELLTERRQEIQGEIQEALQRQLTDAGVGVRVTTVEIVDVHPPGDAVFAFRDVSSAKEDRETRIHRAHEERAWELPWARGSAAKVVTDAEADALRNVEEASGTSEAFLARAQPYRRHPRIVNRLLWLETVEQVLEGREKYVMPGDSPPGGLTLWPERQVPLPPVSEGGSR